MSPVILSWCWLPLWGFFQAAHPSPVDLELSASSPHAYPGQEITVSLSLSLGERALLSRPDVPLELSIPWLEADLDWADDLRSWRKRYSQPTSGPPVTVNGDPVPIYPEPVASGPEPVIPAPIRYVFRRSLTVPEPDSINQGRLRLAPVKLRWGATSLTSQSLDLPIRQVPPPLHSLSLLHLGVGDFLLRVSVDRNSVELGESLRLTLRLSGQGPLRKVPAPTPSQLARFLPPEKFLVEPAGEQWSADRTEKRFHYLLHPRTAEIVEVPSIGYACFDTIREQWLSRSTAAVPLTVRPKDEQRSSPGVGLPAPVPGRLRFGALTEAGLQESPGHLPRELVLVVMFLPPMLFLLLGSVRWLSSRGQKQRTRSEAARLALSRLERRSSPTPDELGKVILDYLSDRFGTIPGEPTAEELWRLLSRAGLAPALRRQVLAWWEQVTAARFLPAAGDARQEALALERLARQARELVLMLEAIR